MYLGTTSEADVQDKDYSVMYIAEIEDDVRIGPNAGIYTNDSSDKRK